MKRIMRKTISLVLSLSLVLTALPAGVYGETKEDGFTITDKNVKIQEYKNEDGKTHTIYWTRGVNPPKMTGDKDKYGTPGYFEVDKTVTPKLSNITYQAPMENGNGYFDLNKSLSLESHMCYLASGGNLIHWWLQQNSKYIEEYRKGINSGRFGQEEGLTDISKADWDYITSVPELRSVNGLTQQLLRDSSLSNTAFKENYYKRYDDGYWVDPVIDFFINGYRAIHSIAYNDAPVNNPEMFEKDINGGYFHPVFGKEVLTERHSTANYQFYNERFKEWILSGKAISISYNLNAYIAHAITAWGVEYDENGNLCRVYITDSDDMNNNSLKKTDTVRGLYSLDVRNIDNLFYMGNNTGPAAGNGNLMKCVSVLDLGQDKWEKALKDQNTEPGEPVIKENISGRKYALNASAEPLVVKAGIPEQDKGADGYLTYQWYKADKENEQGIAIKGATEEKYTPLIGNELKKEYYYCEIANHKYGKVKKIKSSYAEIETIDAPLKSAVKPELSFNASSKDYPQNSNIVLKVEVLNKDKLRDYSYQWYEADNNGNPTRRWKVMGATEPELKVPSGEMGSHFYYCKVTNVDKSPDITGHQTVSTDTGIKRVRITEPVYKAAQAELFIEDIPEKPAYGTEFKPSFKGGSGNGEISWTVSGPAVKVNNDTVKITGIGEIKISAVKQGDENYFETRKEATVISVKAAGKEAPEFRGEYKVSSRYNDKFVYVIEPLAGCEYSSDGGNTWQESNVFDNISPLTEMDFTVRIRETDFVNAGKKGAVKNVVFNRLSNDKIPELDFSVETEGNNPQITIKEVDGAEYSFDGGRTFSSENTKKNCERGTSVFLAIRFKETGTLKASSVKTAEAVIPEGIFEGIVTEGFRGSFDGVSHKIKVNVPLLSDITYSETEDGIYTSLNPEYKDAGTYTVYYKVSKPGYATATGHETIEILPAELKSEDISLSEDNFVYNGKAFKPAVKIYGFEEGKDFDVTYENNINSGMGIVNINGRGNCKGNIIKNFTIKPAPLKGTVELNSSFIKVNGKYKVKTTGSNIIINPVVKTSEGRELVNKRDYEIKHNTVKNPGTYSINVIGKGNYEGNLKQTLIVTPSVVQNVNVRLRAQNFDGYNDAYVTWNKVNGATGYNVYMRRPGKTKEWTFAGSVKGTGNSFLRKNLYGGQTYQFKVLPYVKSGDINYRTTAGYKIVSLNTMKKLKMPSAVKSKGKVKLTWENVKGRTGYQVGVTSKGKTKYYKTSYNYMNFNQSKKKTSVYKVRVYKVIKKNGKNFTVYAPWSENRKYTLY